MIRDFRPDVVHGWNFSGLSKSMLWTLRQEGTPAAFCVCDHWIARAAEADVWLKWWNEERPSSAQRVFRRALEISGQRRRWEAEAPMETMARLEFRRVYFCSAALRELTARAGFAVENAEIIRCSVDTERFSGTPRSSDAPMSRLLFVGRLHPDKGPMTALRAMARLRDKYAGRLSIYGRGEAAYEAELKNFVRESELPVTFHEGSPEEMPRVYAAHDGLLFTSEWLEPFAITPLEAMASGLPVISTLTGGSAELFRHGANALTFEAGDADDLARQILRLDRDRELRRQIAAQGQQDVRDACSDERVARQTEAYLEETIRLWTR
jgi:glycosyltransferase involved in cell wall biosynthesis